MPSSPRPRRRPLSCPSRWSRMLLLGGAASLLLPLVVAGCLDTKVAGDAILPPVDGALPPPPDVAVTPDMPVVQPDMVVQPPPELPYSEALTPYVLPGDGRDFITNLLSSATTDVKLVMYLFTDNTLVQAVADTARRGVRVRLLIDSSTMTRDDNAEAVADLTAAGVEVKTGASNFTFTHEKAIIVDDAKVLVMTCNFTVSAFQDNREYAVLDTEPDDVTAASSAFEADWNRTSVNLAAARPVVSPDNARDRMRRFLAGAQSKIDLEVEALGDPVLVSVISDRASAGVAVRLLIDENGLGDPDITRLEALPTVEVRTIPNITIHSKMVIVDGSALYVGSINLTANSLDRNRELGVLTKNAGVLSRFQSTFDSGWAGATTP